MPPRSIKLFERIYFASLALSILHFALFDRSDPEMAGIDDGWMIGIWIFIVLIALAFWFFIVRRASNFMRWVFVIFVLIGVIVNASEAQATLARGWSVITLTLALQLLDIVCILLLFSAESRRWFANKGRVGEIDPDVFR
jgi:asparagine N-glycosylation enzyme membrane subunit Stt3